MVSTEEGPGKKFAETLYTHETEQVRHKSVSTWLLQACAATVRQNKDEWVYLSFSKYTLGTEYNKKAAWTSIPLSGDSHSQQQNHASQKSLEK